MPHTRIRTDQLPLDALSGIQSAAAAALSTMAMTLRADGNPVLAPSAAGPFYRSVSLFPAGAKWLLSVAAPAAREAMDRQVRVAVRSTTGIAVVAWPYVLDDSAPAALIVFTTPGPRPGFVKALAADLGLPPDAVHEANGSTDQGHMAATLQLVEQSVLMVERSARTGDWKVDSEVRRSRVIADAARSLSRPMTEDQILDCVTDILTGVLRMESGIPYVRTETGWQPGQVFSISGTADAPPPALHLNAAEMDALVQGRVVPRRLAGSRSGSILLVPLSLGELDAVISLRARHAVPPPQAADEDMVSVLTRHATAVLRNARNAALEHSLARTLQDTLQSRVSPRLEGVQVVARYTPAAREANVGGDFYDVFPLPDGQVAVLVGDVAGKGVSAAIHTNLVRYTLRSYALLSSDPAEVLQRTNDALVGYEDFEDFVSLALVVLDSEANRLHYASAGHCPVLLYRSRADAAGFLNSTGTILGVMPGQTWESHSEKWAPGDRLLLYTDGVSEAHPPGSFELFETDGVKTAFMAHRNETADRIVQAVYQAALDYSGGVLHDDCALLLVTCPGDK